MARHGYAADAPFSETPRDARYRYAKRFSIEASYNLSEQSIATTSAQGESAVAERLAVSALGICGDAPPWRASPLVLVIQGIHQHDSTGSVDGPRNPSGRPRKSTTGRLIPSLTTDQVCPFPSGNAVASAADRRSRPTIQLLCESHRLLVHGRQLLSREFRPGIRSSLVSTIPSGWFTSTVAWTSCSTVAPNFGVSSTTGKPSSSTACTSACLSACSSTVTTLLLELVLDIRVH